MTALNPNHPSAAITDGEWQTIAAVLLKKLSPDHPVMITPADIDSFFDADLALRVASNNDLLRLSITTKHCAQAIAKKHGGLPS